MQLDGLIATIDGLSLTPAGIASSLDSKLQAARQANNTNAACGEMNAFINDVTAQSGNKLTATQAQQLLSSANAIKTSLGCP